MCTVASRSTSNLCLDKRKKGRGGNTAAFSVLGVPLATAENIFQIAVAILT